MTASSIVATTPARSSAMPGRPRVRPTPFTRERELAMLYEASGGLVSDRALLQWLRDLGEEQPISKLARWIVERRVVSFGDEAQMWFPRFQFELGVAWVRPAVLRVLGEFDGVLDQLETAQWFATPSPWLQDEAPAERIARAAHDVVEAARIDRFLLTG